MKSVKCNRIFDKIKSRCDHSFLRRMQNKSMTPLADKWNNAVFQEEHYTAPNWCSKLNNIPQTRLKIAQLPTQIHRWNLPDIPKDYEIYIKRDDNTGNTVSGNKVRKLEFIFADLIRRGCKHVITCGSLQSNHCRATSAVAAQLGLKCHLVLRSPAQHDIQSVDDIDLVGNVLLNSMFGCTTYIVPSSSPYETHLKPRMQKIAEKIREDENEDSYLIPVGGSDAVGIYGYLECYRELLEQGILDNITDIVFACGSGGTAEGLAVANYLTGGINKIRIHGIAVSDNGEYFHRHADTIMEKIGLKGVQSRDILHIIDGYKGKGYGISAIQDLEFIQKVSATTGIVLDPVYTGKAVKGLVTELRENPQRFKGNKILYIHTGGIFGAMDGQISRMLKSTRQDLPVAPTFHMWRDPENSPF